MSLLQRPTGKPVSADPGIPPSGGTEECPECRCAFVRHHPGQLFCTPAHRDAWNNRATVRGRVLTPLAIVARITRNGTRHDRETGARAASHQHALITRWRDEDAAAGRMPHDQYLARRYRAGFDPL